MPKLSQFIKNVVQDKNERSEDCFKVAVNENNIELCNSVNGEKITSPSMLPGIDRYSNLGKSRLDYCLDALKKKGVVECGNPTKVIENYSSREVQCINGRKDIVQIRDTLLKDSQSPISIGKSFKADGTK